MTPQWTVDGRTRRSLADEVPATLVDLVGQYEDGHIVSRVLFGVIQHRIYTTRVEGSALSLSIPTAPGHRGSETGINLVRDAATREAHAHHGV